MISLLRPEFIFQDERGVICQLASFGWKQVNVITTKAGSRRGRMHYHAKNSEAFYIASGKVEYQCRSIKTGECAKYTFEAGDFWCASPYIGHDFYYLEDTILISMYSLGVDLPDGTRDIVELGEQ